MTCQRQSKRLTVVTVDHTWLLTLNADLVLLYFLPPTPDTDSALRPLWKKSQCFSYSDTNKAVFFSVLFPLEPCGQTGPPGLACENIQLCLKPSCSHSHWPWTVHLHSSDRTRHRKGCFSNFFLSFTCTCRLLLPFSDRVNKTRAHFLPVVHTFMCVYTT